MKPEQIFNVTKEMQALFDEFEQLAADKALDGQLTGKFWDERDEAVRQYASKAAAIVIKHAKWPADLADRLDKVSAYIKAHPEQIEQKPSNQPTEQ